MRKKDTTQEEALTAYLTWYNTRALNRLKGILDGSAMPSVILSDIEIVLINAIEIIGILMELVTFDGAPFPMHSICYVGDI